MCEDCTNPDGYIFSDTQDVRLAASMIRDLYDFAPSGGCMHIVTDDGNLETAHVEWCLDNAYTYTGATDAAEHAIEIATGLLLLELNEDERWSALAIAHGW